MRNFNVKIDGEYAGASRPVEILGHDDRAQVYIQVNPNAPSRVRVENLLEALAKVLGVEITVREYKVIPAVREVVSERTYG